MYGEFSFDIVPGQVPNEVVLLQVLQEFDFKPSGAVRLRCSLLSDTFICEIANTQDYEDTNSRLSALRATLGDQFSYTFSLRRKGDPIRIRGSHDSTLAARIVNS
ncbi:MAG TPA: hypothetical protein VJ691_07870 [Vicinamibacterales bacterium]|nr:hypothetical protein [Vicinamibacterales bacterium]